MTAVLKISDPIGMRVADIETELCSYIGFVPDYSAEDFIATLEESFLMDICPEACSIPAALVVWEEQQESNVSIHLREDVFAILNQNAATKSLLGSQDGLTAFLILVEEISHFHYYARHAEQNIKISRFEMELQAELEKPIVTALILSKCFGRPHFNQLIEIIFDRSTIHGSMTDYKLASKIAEKFWKDHLRSHGDSIIHSSSFRSLFQKISRQNGTTKQRLISEGDAKLAA